MTSRLGGGLMLARRGGFAMNPLRRPIHRPIRLRQHRLNLREHPDRPWRSHSQRAQACVRVGVPCENAIPAAALMSRQRSRPSRARQSTRTTRGTDMARAETKKDWAHR